MTIKGTGAWFLAGLVLLDALCILLAMELANYARGVLGFLDTGVLDAILQGLWLPATACWIVVIAVLGGYRSADLGAGLREHTSIVNSGFVMGGLLATALYLTRTPLSRVFFFALLLIGTGLLCVGRLLARRVLHELRRRGHFGSRVLVVGSRPEIAELSRVMADSTWLGLQLAGTRVDDATAADQDNDHREMVEELLSTADDLEIDLILFAAGSVPSSTDFRRYMWQFEGHHTQLAVVPSLVDVAADRVRTRPLAGLPIVFVEDPRSRGALSLGKRILDLGLSLLFIVLFSPLLIVTALLVRADGGPALYRQTRIGREGKPFAMLKFRSMVVDADQRLAELPDGHTVNQRMFKLADDPRVTRIGRFIRRYSIDELPQLFSVVIGDMSLIGPRPALPSEVSHYTADERQRLRVRPGITGLWQVSGRSDLTWEQTVRLDLRYIDNWSPWADLAILFKTVRAVLSSDGAY
ncbi:sugar transferase [Tessaracoccus palaemonis]|uniref:Sugar transferase n=1 Tax=Tessaracoccus palaemonis TaxID=2829499 RepID=A0ABX8SI15_9ACTN|nr:sugar transferase [Tessaracoccus palaemonis]QXT62945.1 sugar transferase [Tessaracoccus palaemonis]